MVFGVCEGATDGCRRLIKSCPLGRGSGSWSVRLAQQLIVLSCAYSIQSSFQVVPFTQPFRCLEYASFSIGIPPHRCELL